MHDPAPHIDPKLESAIEETRQLLEIYLRSDYWKGDPPDSTAPLWAAIKEIAFSNLSDQTKSLGQAVLFERTKKRQRGAPTLNYRDNALCIAAGILAARGYHPTRNVATDHTESASSIIHEALSRLDVELEEKSINEIVLRYPLIKPA